MTWLEAARIAYSELGEPPENIERRISAAHFAIPNAAIGQEIILKPGKTERGFIEDLKTILKKLEAIPDKELLKAVGGPLGDSRTQN